MRRNILNIELNESQGADLSKWIGTIAMQGEIEADTLEQTSISISRSDDRTTLKLERTDALLKAQLRDKDPRIRQELIYEIAEMGEELDKLIISEMVGMVNDRVIEVQMAALDVLSELGEKLDSRSIIAIIRNLSDFSIRDEVVDCLVSISEYLDDTAINEISSFLQNRDEDTRCAAKEVLSELCHRLGKEVVYNIIYLLESNDEHVWSAAVDILQQHSYLLDGHAVDAILEIRDAIDTTWQVIEDKKHFALSGIFC